MANKVIKKENRGAYKFPNISRFIPEKVNEGYVFVIIIIFIFTSALVVGFDLYQNLSLERKLVRQGSEIQRKLIFWENEAKKHPNYRDAYFNLALINFQLKNFDSSKNYLKKALDIDPNFEKGRRLEEILSNSL